MRRRGIGLSSITLPLYTVTLFLSAFLLFAVQPMFTKMVLPRAGGSPAVWNTSVVFFQALLLAGYLYAHLSTRLLGLKRQTILHAVVLLSAFFVLPITIPAGSVPPPASSPIPWLLGTLAVSVGLPFFAISATAPLLQKWFANTDHAWSGDPYFLYGGSNLGSLAALLSYPVLIEPMLGVRAQSLAWTIGYAVLVAAIGTCAVILWQRYRPEHQIAEEVHEAYVVREVTWGIRGRWVLLSLVPSALLLGVTLHVGSYIAAVPFLWILPLSLYLLTFVFVFARHQWIPRRFWLWAQLIIVPIVAIFFETSQIYVLLVLHLAAMFVSAMVCHGELARLRPVPARLTEFYFFMSLGGVLGGFLSAIVSPLVFDGVYEYPIALLLALLLRPRSAGVAWLEKRVPALQGVAAARLLDIALPIVLWLILADARLRRVLVSTAFAVYQWVYQAYNTLGAWFGDYSVRAESLENAGKLGATLITLALVVWLGGRRPLRFALAVLAVLLALTPDMLMPSATKMGRGFAAVGLGEDVQARFRLIFGLSDDLLARIRSFFGVSTVYVNRIDTTGPLTNDTSRFHYLVHGVTIHGVEYMEVPTLPVSYYTEKGPVGHFFTTMRESGAAPMRVAVLGLGAGALACYMRPGDKLTYFEIDPVVEQVARDATYFRFLEYCGQSVDVVLGDGRLTIAREPDRSYDVIFLDAFSGDGIPVHLLTREAIQLYFQKLAPGGKLMVHITNTFVDLLPVVADLARDANLASLHVEFSPNPATFFALPTNWVVLARAPEDIAALRGGSLPWSEIGGVKPVRTWTDDFTNVFSALKWNQLGLFPKGIEQISTIKINVN